MDRRMLPTTEATNRQGRGYGIYLVVLLTVIYTLNFIDRQIVTILAAPIKAELGLSNTEIGLVSGLAFALFYSILGIPIARLADRSHRGWVIALSCALWSLATAAGGLANSFAQLFLSRLVVGVGEAGCVPASHALIADQVPERHRSLALAVFAVGIPLGSLAGLALGGWVAQVLGWRAALMLVGLPGVIVAVLAFFTLRDPSAAARKAAPARPIGKDLKALSGNPLFVQVTLGAAIASIFAYGVLSFLGIYLTEAFELSLAEVGLYLGLTVGVGGALGSTLGGWLVARSRASLAVPGVALLAGIPCLIVAMWSNSLPLTIGALGLVAFLGAVWYGPVFAAVQASVDPQARAFGASVFMLVVNLVGLGLGPPLIGLGSDLVAGALPEGGPGSEALRLTVIGASVFNLWAAAHFMVAGRHRGVAASPKGGANMNSSTVTGARALVGGLADLGVTHCFSNPGTSELDLVVALTEEPRIRTVPVLFEGVAAGAADGFGRVARRPAATLLHLGPGYMHAAANLHNAKKAFTPIINLVGDHATTHRAFDTPLNSDIRSVVSPQSIWTGDLTTAEDAAAMAVRGVGAAIGGRGPATILVAGDAAWTHTSSTKTEPLAIKCPTVRPAEIQQAVSAILAARKPAILIGAEGLLDAGLKACARLSASGVRVLSEPFPSRQSRGGSRFRPEKLIYFTEMAQVQLADTDLLLTAGAAPPYGFFAYPDRPARHLPDGCLELRLGEPGQDPVPLLNALAEALGAPEIASDEAGTPGHPPQPNGPLTTQTIATSLARWLPAEALVSDDGVTASQPAFAATLTGVNHDWMCLTGGALGQGVPLAIGAALAAPERRVLCLTGDGAAMYTIQGLWTLARENLDVVVIVVANRSYDILKYELKRLGMAAGSQDSMAAMSLDNPAIDHVALARGFGVQAESAATAEAFDALLEKALSERGVGPFLIEAIVPSAVS